MPALSRLPKARRHNDQCLTLLITLTQPTRPTPQAAAAPSQIIAASSSIVQGNWECAGAAGSSTAYHLAQFAEEASLDINITIFEKEPYVGGRSTTVNAYNDSSLPLELGASIFVKINHILVDAAKRFNLTTSSYGHNRVSALSDSPSLGIWDGEQFILVFGPSGPNWWDTAKIIFRYGLAPLRSRNAMKVTINKFLSMYEPPIFPFQSVGAAAQNVLLDTVTASTGVEFLKAHGISTAFAHDVIQASSRVNYAQNLENFHALETMVCLATDDASAVIGGNWQIFSAMTNASRASLLLGAHVDRIEEDEHGRYRLSYSDTVKSQAVQTFDHVVLAAPFQFTDIELAMDVDPPAAIDYVELHVTLFTSPYKIDPTFFGLSRGESAPRTILTTTHCPTGEADCFHDGGHPLDFFSISTLATFNNPETGITEYAYKIFSPHAPSFLWLMALLGTSIDESAITWIYRKVWHSYPYEIPRETHEKMMLADGLWYSAGMESFISTMETNALMGKNIAKLIVQSASKAINHPQKEQHQWG